MQHRSSRLHDELILGDQRIAEPVAAVCERVTFRVAGIEVFVKREST